MSEREDGTAAQEGRLPSIPAHLRALMAEIGPEWGKNVSSNVKLMVAEFSKVLRGGPKGGIERHAGLRYGTHERQAVDVFLPENGERRRPALVFVHGGAFVEGDRNRTPEIYSNVLVYFARHGVVGVNVGYRLAPEARYPEATRDVGAAIAWVKENAGRLGIDPGRIFLMGHSAGGAHVASYAYDRRLHPAEGPGIAGLVILSGRVRADNRPENPNARKVEAYYGADADFEDVSPVNHVDAESVPTFIAWAEYENPLIDVYCAELAYRLAAAKRRSPPLMWLKGHNHTSAVAHIGTDDEALAQAILGFIAEPP
ncbi:MAG: alpha/beta fold hydrolase [Rhodospirillales bacterium]|nr:alpha/beta fold hydrolase [Rhodospirillales bacterium]